MRSAKLFFVLSSLLLLAVWGCERKVTNEIVNNASSTIGADACMECHGDVDIEIVHAHGEWENSRHASGANIDYTNYDRVGAACTKCHAHEGFIDFVTTGEVLDVYENTSAIHCFTCHAPHSTGTLALRKDNAVTLTNGVVFDHGAGNLCANCHQARTATATAVLDSVKLTTRFGPHHSNQAEMIQATGGYLFTGATIRQVAFHGNGVADACITCHMGEEQTHEGYAIGGHSFNMGDEEGNTLVKLCVDCHSEASGASNYDFKLTDASNPTDGDYDYDGTEEGFQTEFHGLMDSLATLLVGENVLTRTVTGTDTTYAPKNNAIVLDKNLTGAVWNFMFLEEDRSKGAHNFTYAIDLLNASINYVESLSAGLAQQ